jgi:hypothetical protein
MMGFGCPKSRGFGSDVRPRLDESWFTSEILAEPH